MFTSFKYLLSASGPILPEVTIERRLTTLKSSQVSRKPRKGHNLLHLFEVRLRLFFICATNNWKIASFTVRQSFSRLHNMSKDGMLKKCRKMSPFQATLKAIAKIF